MPTPTIERLTDLPYSERRYALEALVAADIKSVLYMDDDEELPATESFFDLGLTSLRLTEIKERLEGLLGREISANSLFNSPTLDSLLAHLTDEVLPELFRVPSAPTAQLAVTVPGAVAVPARAEVDDLLRDLYQA